MGISEILRRHGYKVTPQRLAIYEMIKNNLTHPNVESIYQQLQPQYPSMSLATVYKTMEIFAKIGVVTVLQCGEDAHRYDYNTTKHAHIRCVKCNRIADVNIDYDMLRQQALAETGFSVDNVSVSFVGICPECAEKSKV